MKKIRIGTRNSPLALWQAKETEQLLIKLGYSTEIVPISSHGDKNLIQPLYQMDIVGVFTKDLDIALLNNEIDIAVHSLKDIPTQLPEGITLSAVLERDFEQDILIRSSSSQKKEGEFNHLHIGTGSLRRRAFWLASYPEVTFDNIRGNVQTRLQKLESENFDGTIFSLAGIKRLNLPLNYEVLDFIIPAPGQGVVGITSLEDSEYTTILKKINHKTTEICITIERDFLNTLEGGCTAPIGASVRILNNSSIVCKAGLVSLDGKDRVFLLEEFPINQLADIGKKLAEKAKVAGGEQILKNIKDNS